ncbi:MAG: glycosyltransferase [Candidatus Shapirobacteria bacterium]|nr:glycosyltransferase [Candidatus Shapirobacteria bacterium]
MKKSNIAVIVIPTYNEADNIGKMIEYLNTKTFPNIVAKKGDLLESWDMKILVVDGNSPDGTGKIVEKESKKYNNTYLLTETSKDGIGAAYLKGFKYAIDKLKADFVFEFDGDFQHPPETIPLMLKAMEEGYDYVIGSRKIKGGSNPKGWGFKRVFFSEVGGLVARFIMFFPFKNFFKVTDPTTGLKVTRVKGFIDKMDLDWKGDRLLTKSFGYKLQLLFETLKMGAKFKEVPLKFHVRNAGESKIEAKTAKDIFRVAVLLRWNDELTKRFLKFGIVGFIGFIINAFFLNFFSNFMSAPWPWTLSAEVSIVSNFTLNNLWTFKSRQIFGQEKLIKKFLEFNLSSAGAIVIQSIFGTLAEFIFGPGNKTLYLAVIIVFLVLPYNWTMYNLVIWRKKKK